MFKTGLNVIDGHNVFFLDTRLMKSEKEKEVLYVVDAVTAFSIHVDDVVYNTFSELRNNETSDHVLSLVDIAVEGTDLVIINLTANNDLTESEAMGIIYHEIAHIENGDTLSVKTSEVSLEDRVQMELRADAYAASKVGAAVMKSCYLKTINAFIDKYVSEYNVPYEGARSMIMDSDEAQARLRAMDAMSA